MNISIVMLGVADGEKATAFYRDRLALTVTNQHEGFVFLNAGPITLVLSAALGTALGKEPGNTEVVFTVEHVRAAYDSLIAKGVEFLGEPRVTTGIFWSANFKDPDGHLLSIFGPE